MGLIGKWILEWNTGEVVNYQQVFINTNLIFSNAGFPLYQLVVSEDDEKGIFIELFWLRNQTFFKSLNLIRVNQNTLECVFHSDLSIKWIKLD